MPFFFMLYLNAHIACNFDHPHCWSMFEEYPTCIILPEFYQPDTGILVSKPCCVSQCSLSFILLYTFCVLLSKWYAQQHHVLYFKGPFQGVNDWKCTYHEYFIIKAHACNICSHSFLRFPNSWPMGNIAVIYGI